MAVAMAMAMAMAMAIVAVMEIAMAIIRVIATSFTIKNINNKGKQMNIDNLTFGELKQISTLFNSSDNKDAGRKWNGEKVMLFMTHGFIFVGNLYLKNGEYVLENALNCRYQEKGRGWGHIAREGKESCTVDDYSDESLIFFKDKILFIREVDGEKWES